MNETLTQVGVGGLLALLVLREVFQFLKTRRHASHDNGAAIKTAGDFPPEYWQNEQRKAIADVVITVVVPLLTGQATILNELRLSNQDVARTLAVILDRMTQQRP